MRVRLGVIGCLFLLGCGGGGGGGDDAPPIDAFAGPTITRTYQQGSDGYASAKSVGISAYGGLGAIGHYNANGMTFADGQNDWCTGTEIISGNYSEVWLCGSTSSACRRRHVWCRPR